MTQEKVKAKLNAALDTFFRDNLQFLQSGVREEALSHQIANHIQRHFRGWHVDAEYDRLHVEGVPEAKKYIGSDGKQHGAMPDIIIHKRQGHCNLVAIEIKRAENKQSRAKDFDKLRAYKEPPYSYVHAVFLEVGVRDGRPHVAMNFR